MISTQILKAVRAWPPFNALATSTAHALLTASGQRSEFLVKHLPRVGNVETRLPNGRPLKLWSRGDDWVANQVFWKGWNGYDRGVSDVFYSLATRARVTLDIGAHVGYYALLAALANPSGLVFAFEPHGGAMRRLRRNVEQNALGNVTCVEAAATDYVGTIDFFFSTKTEVPSSSGTSEAFLRTVEDLVKVAVPATTVDAFAQERGLTGIDLVKIDTETTEPAVLRGMETVIRRDRPHIVCEVLQGWNEDVLTEWVRAHGYRAARLEEDRAVPVERVVGHPVYMNYLFSPS